MHIANSYAAVFSIDNIVGVTVFVVVTPVFFRFYHTDISGETNLHCGSVVVEVCHCESALNRRSESIVINSELL